MKVFNDITQVRDIPNAVVTIGTFDGVHIGHQAIFKKMRELAQAVKGQTVVVTFSPHPRQVLNIDSDNLRFICTEDEKLRLFEHFGIDNVIVITFTKTIAHTASETFIKDFIIDCIEPRYIVVGYDHHFGKNRLGDFDQLTQLGQKFNFKVERIEAQDIDEVTVSSTKIRHALAIGDVATANRLLGYPYSVTAEVVRGNEIGRTIGFPTANIELPKEYRLINNAGVYTCLVDYNGMTYKAMANIGKRPTIGDRADDNFIIEVNIFDFDQDLYGQHITVRFLDRIRDEVKFNGLTELKTQLEHDRRMAKAKLSL